MVKECTTKNLQPMIKAFQYIYYRSCTSWIYKRALSPTAAGDTIFWLFTVNYFRILLMGYVLLTQRTSLYITVLHYCGNVFITLGLLMSVIIITLIVDLIMEFLRSIGLKKVIYLETYKQRWADEPKEQRYKRGLAVWAYYVIGLIPLIFAYWRPIGWPV